MSLGHAQEYHPPMADLSFEQEASDLSRVNHKAQRAAALLRVRRLGERSFSDVTVQEDAWMSVCSGEQPFTQGTHGLKPAEE